METGVVKAILADRLNENLQPEWQALFEDGNVQWLPEEAFREFDKSINGASICSCACLHTCA
jgi:hypothetical protein